MVSQTAFLIALHACEAVALLRKTSEASFAVRKKLLAVDNSTRKVDHYIAAAEMVCELKLNCGRRVTRLCGPYAHQGNALPVIHHVKMVVFACCRSIPAVMLK
jgi:hypothetical protein